jgi:hypothetical protein
VLASELGKPIIVSSANQDQGWSWKELRVLPVSVARGAPATPAGIDRSTPRIR